ncbi:hypothetical protein LJR118_002853 [Acidovorax sp. LjRoot118]|uniref:ORC-CDC6 family AAA ATPase n=1 Tax=Acidovorax sp. LjRoot118 TaxID=3342256 RepID=UPI003ECD47B7
MLPTNRAFVKVLKRAEQQDDEVLQKTFVDLGGVYATFETFEHQILFGRRGTGKTHLLSVLRQNRRDAGEIAIQLDMRTIGSAGGIYGDRTIPLHTRATRLLVDVLSAIHSQIVEQLAGTEAMDSPACRQALDSFLEAHREVKVQGTVSVEQTSSGEATEASEASGSLKLSAAPSLEVGGKGSHSSKRVTGEKRVESGVENYRVNFGSVGTATRSLMSTLPKKRLWILIDEWSEVPLDLQPYLADLIRRSLMPARGLFVKIAAIEQRSRFLIPDRMIGNVGLELGADVSTAVNLDEHMVFENNETAAVQFFQKLVLAHVQAALEAEGLPAPGTVQEMLSAGFTQANAFAEVVRACEGVPRDAINILNQAAQKAGTTTISVSEVRAAARQWYLSSKDAAVAADEKAKDLLNWIIDWVIKERQAKGFLLAAGRKDDLIDYLYDARVLHVLRKGMSAQDEPGVRYTVYGIDYGCYVDLINTARAPKGLFNADHMDVQSPVPVTDLRSLRRCILKLDDFYTAQSATGGNASQPSNGAA